MNGFLGDAKYTRTFARRYQDHVNKSWWMTFLVTQNTQGLSPFPSRRSTKMYAKAINIPDKFPWRVPLSWENSARSIPRQGNWVKGLTMWHRKISDLHEDFSIACSIFRNFPSKCLRVSNCTSNQNWCSMRYLKIINTFRFENINMLKQIFEFKALQTSSSVNRCRCQAIIMTIQTPGSKPTNLMTQNKYKYYN